MLGWEPRDRVRRRHRAHDRVLPRSAARGTGDARRRPVERRRSRSSTSPGARPALEPELSQRRSRACCASGHVPPRSRARRAFEAELAAFTGRRHASASRRAPTRCGSSLRRDGRRARRRGDRARVHRGADRGRGVRGRRDAGVRRRRRRRPARIDLEAARSARSPIARAPWSRCTSTVGPPTLPDLGVPVLEDAAQAIGALDPRRRRSAAAAYSFYPTKNLGGITDGGAVRHRRRRRSPPTPCACSRSRDGRHRRLRAHERVDQRPAARRSRRPRCGSGSPAASTPTTRAGGRSRLGYREAAPGLRVAGDAPAPRVPPVRGAGARPGRVPGRGCRSTPACTTRSRSPSSPPTRGSCAQPCPRGGGVGRGVRIVALLPRDDRRRDRGGVSSAPVNPAVVADLRVLPLLQRRGHDRLDGERSRSRRSTRVGSPTAR